jgi:hypothetical protein
MLWKMHEPSGWLCGKVGHCSLFSREMLFWAISCRISKSSRSILTLRLNLVPAYLQMHVIFHLFLTWYDVFQNEIIETSIFSSYD